MKRYSLYEEPERIMPDDKTHKIYLSIHLARYAFARGFVKGKSVLDVACGCGYGSIYIAKAGAKVIGGDNSEVAIYTAKQDYKNEHVQFMLLDAHRLPFRDESFDTVVSFETIEHLSKYNEFVAECWRVLKKQGLFYCSTPNAELTSQGRKQSANIYHVREFYPEEFESLMRKHFSDVVLFAQSLTGTRKVGLTGRIISKLRKTNMLLMKTIPGLHALEVYIANHSLSDYRLLKLEDFNESDFDNLADERHIPFVFQNNLSHSVIVLVAMCHKQ